MNKKITLVLLLNIIFYSSLYSQNSQPNSKAYNGKDLNLTNIEIADDNPKRMQGLMYRSSLCAECAMLFVFDDFASGSFWMKDTKISLDIIFMDSLGTIINYYTNTEPLNTDRTYPPKSEYYYVLETNAGFVKKYKLQEGMRIDLKDLMLRAGDRKQVISLLITQFIKTSILQIKSL